MADDSEQVGQDDIEALLRQAKDGSGEGTPTPDSPESAASGDKSMVDQAEIEALLNGGGAAEPAPTGTAPDASAPLAAAPVGEQTVSQNDIELLLNKAEQALESIDEADSQTVLPAGIRSFEFQKFGGTAANTDSATLELMRDVQLDMTIELGRTHMHLEDVLKLKQGAVVPLDKLAGDPADVYVNGRLVARGEVLVLNDNFCIRVAELIAGENAVA